jgi:hypothetical protein
VNIDERLEALTQTVELLAAMQRDQERVLQRRFEVVDRRFEVVARTFETALDSIKRLENIATAHEQRLDRLEGDR